MTPPLSSTSIILAILGTLATVHFDVGSAVSSGIPIEDMAQFPYLCRFTGPTTCSCSIISRWHIMTAAHCLRAGYAWGLRAAFDRTVTNPSGIFHNLTDIQSNLSVVIRVGTHDFRLNNAINVSAVRVAVPPNYTKTLMPFLLDNPENWIKDMAILELETPLNFTRTVQPAKFLTEKAYKQIPVVDKEKCILAGWGGLNSTNNAVPVGNPLKSQVPHYGYFKLACNEVCAVGAMSYYHYWHNVRNYTGVPYSDDQLGQVYKNMTTAMERGLVCGSPNPSGMEGGNSGGPAVVTNSKTGQVFQIGISQNNFMKTFSSYRIEPFEFTRVSSECEWLGKVTKGAVKCCNDYNEKRVGRKGDGDEKEEE